MQLGDFSAHVVVDGKELEEYDVVIDSSTKATCYIASEEGKTFSVKWQCHAEIRLTDNSGKVMVDGISCGAYMMRSGSLGDEDTRVLSHIGETKARDLMFSRLQLSDDDDLLDKEVPKDLGDISLNIKRGELVKSRRRNRKTESCAPDENLKFHEKSKKATVHCVSFGPERVLRQQTTPSKFRVRVVPNDDPLLVFVFKYRPLGILQANGIAPKPVSVSSGSRHNVNLDECEIEIQDGSYIEDIKPVELDGRIETLENELKRLRSLQAGASQDRKPKRVKKEEPGLEKRLRFTPGEVIDLT